MSGRSAEAWSSEEIIQRKNNSSSVLRRKGCNGGTGLEVGNSSAPGELMGGFNSKAESTENLGLPLNVKPQWKFRKKFGKLNWKAQQA